MTEQTDPRIIGGASACRPSALMRVLLSLTAGIRVGALTVTLPDGTGHRFDGAEAGPHGVLNIHEERLAGRMLSGGALGFCEAYLDGDWSSPDMLALFEMAQRNEVELSRVLRGKGWMRLLHFLLHAARPNSRRGSRRNIARHYDLGNDFYAAWLDPGMTYSAALYADPARPEALAEAQERKYAAIARRMELAPQHHVLEIGCGWGGFADYAARHVGARVTAITISRAQYDYACARIQREGLGEKVEIRLQDYRETTGQFDRIASIEMFEAVGERYWPGFFTMLHDRLKPGGKGALQIITIAERHFAFYRRGADYIQRHIFPGGMLASPERLKTEIKAADLSWQGADAHGQDYARTLLAWQERFQAAWPRLAGQGFDARFKRMWEQYLWYCAAGFRTGRIDLLHVGIGRE